MKVVHDSGNRKRAKARATLKKGTGILRFNSQEWSTVNNVLVRELLREPLIIAGDTAKKINISVTAFGGGIIGQAEAARSAIARVLATHDKKLHKTFMDYDRTLLVTDIRRKETHKPNHHGKARAKKQFSKR